MKLVLCSHILRTLLVSISLKQAHDCYPEVHTRGFREVKRVAWGDQWEKSRAAIKLRGQSQPVPILVINSSPRCPAPLQRRLSKASTPLADCCLMMSPVSQVFSTVPFSRSWQTFGWARLSSFETRCFPSDDLESSRRCAWLPVHHMPWTNQLLSESLIWSGFSKTWDFVGSYNSPVSQMIWSRVQMM